MAQYQTPVFAKSLFQSVNSIGGFLAVCGMMYVLADWSYWAALALAPIAAGLLVRTFIIQHDCGHGAFFGSRWLNNAVGFLCSLFTLAPYRSWGRQHAGHHGIWNNLDKRDSGMDIYSTCLTVAEYQALSPWRRRAYRISRHPLVANIILPPIVFILLFRLPFDMPESWRRERRAVWVTNVAIAGLIVGCGFALGFERVAQIQLPVMALASIIGVWLFSVQHRSERTVWARDAQWNSVTAALDGSNYLRLPRILQWFTGNIGLHHVHHMNPRIPNYRLQECHDRVPELRAVPVTTLGDAFRVMRYVLWDEKRGRMVTFGEVSRRKNLQGAH